MSIKEYEEFRERMNERILNCDNLQIKRFFSLDSQAYKEGALDERTKELMGLAASGVLRCDDCIAYHLLNCLKSGAKEEEIWEVFNIILVIGGSITIPHIRRAVAKMDEYFKDCHNK